MVHIAVELYVVRLFPLHADAGGFVHGFGEHGLLWQTPAPVQPSWHTVEVFV